MIPVIMATKDNRPLPLIFIVWIITAYNVLQMNAEHFRGGTIKWKSEGGLKVHFYFKMGWTYRMGPGCKPNLIGQYVTDLNPHIDYWECISGCPTKVHVHDVNYICTAADSVQKWEQGQYDFTYTFPNEGPFTIGYRGGAWILLSNDKGSGDWMLQTTVDLRKRSDISAINTSPQSMSKPVYHVQFGCPINIKLPVFDADDDRIKCRWAKGNECGSVCDALPAGVLDPDTCTITFNTSTPDYIKDGIYAVAITIEDFPRVPMTLGNRKLTPSDAISSIPIQFLVRTYKSTKPCDSFPRFVTPTPKEGEVITIEESDLARVQLCADNGLSGVSAKANRITAVGITNMKLSHVALDPKRKGTYCTNLSWPSTHKDIGNHLVCGHVQNDAGKDGKQRCFSITVVHKGCNPSPCKNKGKCVSNSKVSSGYKCICRPGYTGVNCETKINHCVLNKIYCPTPTPTTPMLPNPLCPRDYDKCVCYVGKSKKNHWMGLSGQERQIVLFFVGLPCGLALSIFVFFICHQQVICQPWDKKHGCEKARVTPKTVGCKLNKLHT